MLLLKLAPNKHFKYFTDRCHSWSKRDSNFKWHVSSQILAWLYKLIKMILLVETTETLILMQQRYLGSPWFFSGCLSTVSVCWLCHLRMQHFIISRCWGWSFLFYLAELYPETLGILGRLVGPKRKEEISGHIFVTRQSPNCPFEDAFCLICLRHCLGDDFEVSLFCLSWERRFSATVICLWRPGAFLWGRKYSSL